jgi:hypothetical protein
VLIQVAANLVSVHLCEPAFSFRHTVSNSCPSSTLVRALAVGPLAGETEIDDLSHVLLFPMKVPKTPHRQVYLSWSEHPGTNPANRNVLYPITGEPDMRRCSINTTIV